MSEPYKLTWEYTNPREYLRLYEKFEMPPLIITCAITGGWQGKEANPNLPETPDEQAKSTFEAYEAGASIVHVHARDPKKGYADAIDPKRSTMASTSESGNSALTSLSTTQRVEARA